MKNDDKKKRNLPQSKESLETSPPPTPQIFCSLVISLAHSRKTYKLHDPSIYQALTKEMNRQGEEKVAGIVVRILQSGTTMDVDSAIWNTVLYNLLEQQGEISVIYFSWKQQCIS